MEGIDHNPELSKETVALYKQTHNYIVSFVKAQYKIKDIPNESLQKIRDVFIFSVYTGLRYQYVQELEASDIIKNDFGQPFIQMTQHKTGEQVMIPLLKPALTIIDRYDLPEQEITGKILPRITNQKLKTYLKTIFELVGIKKHLTHHLYGLKY